MGTTSGGLEAMRSSLPATRVSRSNACSLSRVSALRTALRFRFSSWRGKRFWYSAMAVSMSSRAYQTSRLPCAAKSIIAIRYDCASSRMIAYRFAGEKPSARPAISKLVARRLRSHSHGPGSVSSKSVTSRM